MLNTNTPETRKLAENCSSVCGCVDLPEGKNIEAIQCFMSGYTHAYSAISELQEYFIGQFRHSNFNLQTSRTTIDDRAKQREDCMVKHFSFSSKNKKIDFG